MSSRPNYIWIVLFALLANVAAATGHVGASPFHATPAICQAQAAIAGVPSPDREAESLCALQVALGGAENTPIPTSPADESLFQALIVDRGITSSPATHCPPATQSQILASLVEPVLPALAVDPWSIPLRPQSLLRGTQGSPHAPPFIA